MKTQQNTHLLIFILLLIQTSSAIHIISFKKYAKQNQHAATLVQLLGKPSTTCKYPTPPFWSSSKSSESSSQHNWYHIPRNNPATQQYPTDFLTIDLSSPTYTIPILLTQHSTIIKSIAEDKSHRSILWSRVTRNKPENQGGTTSYNKYRSPPFPFNPSDNEDEEQEDNSEEETDEDNDTSSQNQETLQKRRRRILNDKRHDFGGDITGAHRAPELWDQGVTGAGIKVAVFDTGVHEDHPHFRNVEERTNWTDEPSLGDGVGHGSFVAGVIASHKNCLGFAPDSKIYTFRVFTNDQISFTSWFLDAFNYAIHSKMDVLNLSIGGPDYLDQPFVDKVRELSANRIIIISAIGNDGPAWGTLNSPADQPEVIGVGGIDNHFRTASFSSRGMTTWELPYGYGRMKPDIVTFSVKLRGSSRIIKNGVAGCRRLGGTSAASPVVAGAVTLLASSIPMELRTCLLNPATMKQVLVESARPIKRTALSENNIASIFEQGSGLMNLPGAYLKIQEILKQGTTATIHPSVLDLTDCPYMWPYCTQPLYYSAMPVIANLTVLNGIGVVGNITAVRFKIISIVSDDSEKNQESNYNDNNNDDSNDSNDSKDSSSMLNVQWTHSTILWPYAGYLAVQLTVSKSGATFNGVIEGVLEVDIESDGDPYNNCPSKQVTANVRIKVRVIPTPPRSKRILWDQYHNIRYPPTFIPRDDLSIQHDVLDWHGDHPHTNYHNAYDALIKAGYYIEILHNDMTCFNALNYGTLLLVDSEEEYYKEEIVKLKNDVYTHGLSVVVFADWYDLEIVKKVSFFDENTRDYWEASTGGSNVPAINDLLVPYGIAFGSKVYRGTIKAEVRTMSRRGAPTALFRSGNGLVRFPIEGKVYRARLEDESSSFLGRGKNHMVEVPILGIYQTINDNKNTATFDKENGGSLHESGRIAVYGDSNCIDSSHMKDEPCYWLLVDLIQYTNEKILTERLSKMTKDEVNEKDPLNIDAPHLLPKRREDSQYMEAASKVLGGTVGQCLYT